MRIPQRKALVAAVLALACSGDSPTGPAARAAAVAITNVPAEAVLLVGANRDLDAGVTNNEGAAITRPLQWSSSNTAIASVSAAGEVTGVAAGPVLIVARADNVADTVMISVRVPIPTTPAGAGAPVTTTVLGGAVALTIPPGASTATQLTVAPAALLPDDDRLLSGTAFDFGPSGTTFSAPVTMSLRYTAAAVPPAKRARLRIHRVEADGSLTLLDGGAVDEANARVTAPVSSFSTYAIVVPPDVASITLLEGNAQPALVGDTIAGQSVILRDAQGRGVPLVQVGFSVASGGGSLIGPTLAVTDADGIATLPGSWQLGPTKGQQTLRATIVGDGRFVTFSAFVTAPATQLRVNDGAPTSAISGVSLSAPIVVQVLDALGDPVNEIGRTVTARLVQGSGALIGDTVMNAPTGSAIFQNLRIAGRGEHRIAFVSGTLLPDTSTTIDVTQQVGQLVIVTPPAAALSGVPFGTQPVIELRDNAGLLIIDGSDTVTASKVHGPGDPFGGLRAVAVNGIATFSGLGIEGEGLQRLRFSSGFVDVISDEFLVGPAPEGVYLRVGLLPSIDLNRGQGYAPDLRVDLSNRGTANLRRIQIELRWDPTRLDWAGGVPLPWADSSGTNATVAVDDSRAGEGIVVVTGETPFANVASFTLLRSSFSVRSDSPLGLTQVTAILLEALNDASAAVPVNVRPLIVNVGAPF